MIDFIFASTVLIIGDSHSVGPFGWNLDENFRKSGNQVATYASCGSIAEWWKSGKKTTCGFYSKDINSHENRANSHATPKLFTLLKEVKPDAVIIGLGSNYAKTPSDDFVKKDLKEMVSTIKSAGAQCYWVTPPDMRIFRSAIPRLMKLITDAVGTDCRIFESHTVTQYPTTGGDGIHYWFKEGTPVAQNWAKEVFEDFRRGNE